MFGFVCACLGMCGPVWAYVGVFVPVDTCLGTVRLVALVRACPGLLGHVLACVGVFERF